MIIGELKPLNEIAAKVQGYKRILVAGCGGCVTVCQTGELPRRKPWPVYWH